MELKLTADLIRAHLFNGGFRPMTKQDYYAYADADEGSLIADIRLGRYAYTVLFSPATGDVEISTFDEKNGQVSAWNMDLNNGNVIQLA
jgi:hypothetical protein